jgi:hypothetical protein
LNSLDGTVIGMCQERHRHQEWLKFLRVIDDVTPADKEQPSGTGKVFAATHSRTPNAPPPPF